MLLKIKMKNVYSIEECEIDFTKGRYSFKKDMVYQDKYVNPLAIYGYNGSGKSALINGIGFIVSLMNEGETINLEPNLLLEQIIRKKHQDFPYLVSTIELTFNIKDNLYYYKVQYCKGNVINEELVLNRLKLAERNLEGIVLYLNYASYIKLNDSSKSMLYQLKDILPEAYDYLSQIVYVADHRTNSIAKCLLDSDIYHILVKYSEQINTVLERALHTYSYKIICEHNKYYILYDETEKLPIEYLSNGMFNECLLIALILVSKENGIIFVDEIERSLHPFVIQEIFKLVKEKNIQLIFTSHNTHIMSLLRPDQIYFASFANFKTSFARLSSLESNIREVNNIEKMYLSYAFHKKEEK